MLDFFFLLLSFFARLSRSIREQAVESNGGEDPGFGFF